MDELELGMCQSLSSELKKTISRKKNMWYTVYIYISIRWGTCIQIKKMKYSCRSASCQIYLNSKIHPSEVPEKNQTNANDLIIPTWYGRLKTAILQAPCGIFTNKAT